MTGMQSKRAMAQQTIQGVPPVKAQWKTRTEACWLPTQYAEQVPAGYLVVDVIPEISQWIQTQPAHRWKWGEEVARDFIYTRYIIAEELYTWIRMRWA